MRIRKFMERDAGDVMQIQNHYIRETAAIFDETEKTEEDVRKMMAESACCLVAEKDDKIVGYACVHPWKTKTACRRTEEISVYVAADALAKGIGRLLLGSLIEDRKRKGIHVLMACITAENSRSRDFHEKMGFRKVSDIKEVAWKFGRYYGLTDYQLLLDEDGKDDKAI